MKRNKVFPHCAGPGPSVEPNHAYDPIKYIYSWPGAGPSAEVPGTPTRLTEGVGGQTPGEVVGHGDVVAGAGVPGAAGMGGAGIHEMQYREHGKGGTRTQGAGPGSA